MSVRKIEIPFYNTDYCSLLLKESESIQEQDVPCKTQKTAYGPKNDFFRIFFSVAQLYVEMKLFCFYQNFISSAVQRSHGGTKKSVTSNERTMKERTSNERTTNGLHGRS